MWNSNRTLTIFSQEASLTHSLIHSRSWALLEKLPIVQLLKNFPAFYWTRKFITVFKRALHWSLSWARSIESTPCHPIARSLQNEKKKFRILYETKRRVNSFSKSKANKQQSARKCFRVFSNSVKRSPPWEANSRSANHEILRLSRHRKIHYGGHKTPSLIIRFCAAL
jgi:hypothetical protein